MDRDLRLGSPRVRVSRATKLAPCTASITTRLATYPELGRIRPFEVVRAAGYAGGITQIRDFLGDANLDAQRAERVFHRHQA